MNRKYKLIIISLILLFLGSFSSASAVTCGRVDSNGDYWYQCDGVQSTKTAFGIYGDTITNFTVLSTTTTWTFYDGLAKTITNYSSTLLVGNCIAPNAQKTVMVDYADKYAGNGVYIENQFYLTDYFSLGILNNSNQINLTSEYPAYASFIYPTGNPGKLRCNAGGLDPINLSKANPSYYSGGPSTGSKWFSSSASIDFNTWLAKRGASEGGWGKCTGGWGDYPGACQSCLDFISVTVYYCAPVITVLPTPTISLSASPSTINYGATSNLTWSSTNANSCSATWTTSTATSGATTTPSLTSTTAFPITCIGTGGSTSTSVTVTVNHPPTPPPPVISTSTNPTDTRYNIACGGTLNINWDSVLNATRYAVVKKINSGSYAEVQWYPLIKPNYTYNDSSFSPGDTLYYKVRAYNSAGDYSDSVETSFYIPITCNNPNTFQSISTSTTCQATQDQTGQPYRATTTFVNKQITWDIGGTTLGGITIPRYASTTWEGKDVLLTPEAATTTFRKLYTTVGLKTIYATSTWIDNSTKYTATSSCSTNVTQGPDIIREI